MKRLLAYIALSWATCGGVYLSAQDTKPVSSPAGAVFRGGDSTPPTPGTAPRAKALPDVPSGVTARPGQLVRVVVKSESEVGFLRSFTDDDAFFDELAPKPGQRRFVFQSDRPGIYVVGFWNKGELEGVSCKITVTGTVPPKPDDPVDPPNPDKPAPIDGDGFKVLIVYEAMTTDNMTPGQQSAVYGAAFRDFIKSKGGEFRIWDKDTPLDSAPAHWAKAMKRERKSIPWIIVSNGKTGFEGALPANETDIMALLNRYAK